MLSSAGEAQKHAVEPMSRVAPAPCRLAIGLSSWPDGQLANARCFDSIATAVAKCRFLSLHVMVVADSANDAAARLREQAAAHRLRCATAAVPETGDPNAVPRAASEAGADLCLVMDGRAFLHPDCLAEIEAHIAACAAPGVVALRSLPCQPPDGDAARLVPCLATDEAPASGAPRAIVLYDAADAAGLDATGAAATRNDAASIIVRVHAPDRLEDLSLALATVALQSHEPIEIIVVCQRFADADLAGVRRVAAEIPWGSPERLWRVLNFDTPTPYADCRADLLNLGLAHARGRYIAFLDYDDFLFAGFLASNIAALRAGTCAASVSGVIAARMDGRGLSGVVRSTHVPFDTRAHYRFFAHNHHALQCYVIDRKRVRMPLAFTPGMCRHEDYWFFLRLLATHPLDRRHVATPLGQYCRSE